MASPIDTGSQFINVTTSDTLPLKYVSAVTSNLEPRACRGILLGVAGNIAIKDDNDTTVIISGLAAGIIHPISTSQIMSTNTTASDIACFF